MSSLLLFARSWELQLGVFHLRRPAPRPLWSAHCAALPCCKPEVTGNLFVDLVNLRRVEGFYLRQTLNFQVKFWEYLVMAQWTAKFRVVSLEQFAINSARQQSLNALSDKLLSSLSMGRFLKKELWECRGLRRRVGGVWGRSVPITRKKIR